MASAMRSRKSNMFFYALMVPLIAGLAGFGISDVLSGRGRDDVASVGNSTISAQEYARALQQSLRSLSQQFGQQLTMEQGRLFGIDSDTLERLLSSRALENEATARGVLADDKMVSDVIVATSAFQSVNGGFDKDAYAYALQNAGYDTREYEALIRAQLSRDLMAGAITDGFVLDDTAAAAFAAFLYELRSVDWVRISPSDIAPVAEPTDADLAAWHAAHPEAYTLPEQRAITALVMSPENIAAGVLITDEDVAAAYAESASIYENPARRGLDRLVFADMTAAESARAQLDSGAVTFDQLVTQRGLTPELVGLGIVDGRTLSASARAAVFAATELGIVGPVETDLGPALFRISAIIAASTVPLEAVADEIRANLAEPIVQARIAEILPQIEELIAAGATIEEAAAETGLPLQTIVLGAPAATGLATQAKFIAEASAAALGMERDPVEADDGTIFALRVDSITPPTVQPLADVRDQVIADWTADAQAAALTAHVEAFQAEITAGAAFLSVADAQGLAVVNTPGISRQNPGEALPNAAAIVAFDLAAGETGFAADGDGFILMHIASVEQADPATYADFITEHQRAAEQAISNDVYAFFAAAIRDTAGVTLNPALLDSVVASIQ